MFQSLIHGHKSQNRDKCSFLSDPLREKSEKTGLKRQSIIMSVLFCARDCPSTQQCCQIATFQSKITLKLSVYPVQISLLLNFYLLFFRIIDCRIFPMFCKVPYHNSLKNRCLKNFQLYYVSTYSWCIIS